MTKQCGIYIITNTVNGKRYVGSSCNIQHRWSNHKSDLRHQKHGNSHLQHAWNRYGEESFVFEVALLCEISDLFYYEQAYIDTLKPEYNTSPCASTLFLMGELNPMFGKQPSEETRRKLSAACKGKPFSEEHKRKIGEAMKGNTHGAGYKHTEETRRRLSEAKMGNQHTLGYRHTEESKRKISEANAGVNSPHFGKHPTEETRRKISEAGKGRRYSEESRRKMSEAQFKRWAERKANQTKL